MTTEVDLRLRGGVRAASTARAALDALDGSISSGVVEDMRLLVTELVANSVKHAELGEDDPIYLRVSVRPGCLRVEVADDGPGFSPRPRSEPLTEPRGWGLYLVEEISDRWGVERNGSTRVWFEIDFETLRRDQ